MKIIPLWRSIGNFGRVIIISIIVVASLLFLSSCQNQISQSKKVTNVTLWQGINPPINRDVFNKLVIKFNKQHPDIYVDSIFAGGVDQQLPKILTAVVGNAAPDILYFYPQFTGQLAELGAIEPLDNWFDKLSLKPEVDLNSLAELKLDGHLWSVPLYTSNMGVFYRRDLFKKAGITETPKTWEEFKQVAKKLTIDKNGDKRPEQYGMLLPLGKGEWTVFSWFPFLLSAGGEVVNNNYPDLTNNGAVTALKFWEELIKNGTATLSPLERGYEEDAFLTGRVAMQITGPWTYIAKSDVDYGVFPIPSDKNPATVIGGGNLFLMKTTPEKQKAALQFLEFVMSEKFQTEWSMGTGFLPINLKSAASSEYQEYLKIKPWLKVFVDQMSVARFRPTIVGYSRISDSLGRAIESTLLGKSSAEEALKEAQERLKLIWSN